MTPNANLERLHDAGVSIWLDTLSRRLLDSGDFAGLIDDCSVTGATSNPTIFATAITGSDLYDQQLRRLASEGNHDTRELFFALALDDVRAAARELRSAYDHSDGRDGFISFECTPDLADDTEATIIQATELWQRLDQPNVLIKVPGTQAGLPAIEELTRRGINVNVTLLFALDRYEAVIDAYLRGLTARAAAGESLAGMASVASFFLSRIDTKVDARLAADSPLRGRVAIASARAAYQRYLAKFAGPEWERLEALGARSQRPLWASTGTKNPEYSDVLYVAELVAPDVISTMPQQTLRAFADHGEVARTLDAEPARADQTLADAAATGIDLAAITATLEREGVQAFCKSYHQLLDCIEGKLGALDRRSPTAQRVLVLTNEDLADANEVPESIRPLLDAAEEVYVVAPTLTTWMQWLADDRDSALVAADERLRTVFDHMRAGGLEPHGEIGAENQVTAITDALARFDADLIVLRLHAPGSEHENWREHRIAEKVRSHFDVATVVFYFDSEGLVVERDEA